MAGVSGPGNPAGAPAGRSGPEGPSEGSADVTGPLVGISGQAGIPASRPAVRRDRPGRGRFGTAMRRLMVTPTFAAGLGVVVAASLAANMTKTVLHFSSPLPGGQCQIGACHLQPSHGGTLASARPGVPIAVPRKRWEPGAARPGASRRMPGAWPGRVATARSGSPTRSPSSGRAASPTRSRSAAWPGRAAAGASRWPIPGPGSPACRAPAGSGAPRTLAWRRGRSRAAPAVTSRAVISQAATGTRDGREPAGRRRVIRVAGRCPVRHHGGRPADAPVWLLLQRPALRVQRGRAEMSAAREAPGPTSAAGSSQGAGARAGAAAR